VDIDDAIVIQPKEHIVGSMGAGKRRQRDSV